MTSWRRTTSCWLMTRTRAASADGGGVSLISPVALLMAACASDFPHYVTARPLPSRLAPNSVRAGAVAEGVTDVPALNGQSVAQSPEAGRQQPCTPRPGRDHRHVRSLANVRRWRAHRVL